MSPRLLRLLQRGRRGRGFSSLQDFWDWNAAEARYDEDEE